MAPKPVVLWFRRDLRLHDNPALNQAAATGRPVRGRPGSIDGGTIAPTAAHRYVQRMLPA